MTETRAQWLVNRRRGIGGSDVAAIMGLSPYRTPLDVYLDKIGEGADQPDNTAMKFGRLLEPVLLDLYQQETGQELIPVAVSYCHPQHDWMRASLDGATSTRLVEIKTARSGDAWGEIGTDQVPDYYLLQVQHYMMVTGYTVADIAVLIGGSDFRIYTVYADTDLQQLLFDKERNFWLRVLDRIPPDPINTSDLIKRYPKPLESSVEADPDLLEKIARLSVINEDIKALELISDNLKTDLQMAIGAAEGISFCGKPLVTWKAQTTNRFDQKSFQTDHQSLFDQYKTTTSTRVFRMSK